MLGKVRSTLEGFARCLQGMHEINDYIAGATSQAKADLNTPEADGAEVQTTYSQAATLLASAENYLYGMAQLLHEPVAHFSFLAIGRACLENAARAWWLLDPRIDAKTRAGRGLDVRLRSLWEASSLMDDEGAKDLLRSSQARAAKVAESARDQGFVVAETKRGYVLHDIERKNATDLCEMMIPGVGRFMYKLLSASTHGTTYALMQHYTPEKSDRGGMGWIVQPDDDFSMMGYTAAVAGLAFSAAGDRQVELYGWDSGPWVSWKRQGIPVLRSLLGIVPKPKS